MSFILTKTDSDGEFLVCGLTENENTARAWQAGIGHRVSDVDMESEIAPNGYEELEWS